jgi:hypothetical protein
MLRVITIATTQNHRAGDSRMAKLAVRTFSA